MRILVTDQGKDLVKLLSVEYLQEVDKKLNQSEQSQKNLKSQRSNNLSRNHLTTQASSTKSKNHSYENTRELEIKIKKIVISKNLTEKYNQDTSHSNILLNLPDLVQKKLLQNTNMNSIYKKGTIENNNDLSNSQFSIRDIIPQSSYQNFKCELKNDIRIKEKLGVIDESNFRSIFKDKTENQILEEKLNKKVSTDRLNIIRYLSGKQNLNYQFVQKMTSFDDERLNKINKICQKVFENDEKNELFNKIAKEKINLKKRKDITEYKHRLETLCNSISSANDIEKNYSLPKNVRINKFSDIHDDLKKNFWSKHSVQKLSMNRGLPKMMASQSHF